MDFSFNFLALIVAAFIPTIVGFIWYNPKVFGTAWMQSIGKTEKELEQGFNMPLVMGISFVLSFLLAFGLDFIIEFIHKDVVDGQLVFGSNHSFGHGFLHGFMLSIFLAIPILVTNGLFERRSFKNLAIHIGYWMLTFGLIGGLTDMWN